MAHPFAAIFALVVAALIIIFGVSVLRDLYNVSNTVDITSLRNTLQKEVDAYYILDEGSQKTLTLPVPKQVAFICFVDQSGFIDYSLIPNNKDNIVRTLTDRNVFLISEQGQPSVDPPAFTIKNLKPESNPLCIRTVGSLSARIISKGTHVSILQ